MGCAPVKQTHKEKEKTIIENYQVAERDKQN